MVQAARERVSLKSPLKRFRLPFLFYNIIVYTGVWDSSTAVTRDGDGFLLGKCVWRRDLTRSMVDCGYSIETNGLPMGGVTIFIGTFLRRIFINFTVGYWIKQALIAGVLF